MSTAIVVQDLGFAWPDGDRVFESLSLTVGPGRTGLVGGNGSGKTTLLRLIAGRLRPSAGSVHVAGSLGYLRQDITLDTSTRVDELLGIAGTRRALREIERGGTAEELFTAVGDDWDVDERARAALDRLGLHHVDPDRTVGHVSGGEAVLLGLAAQLVRRPDVLLLDEPTNNLDLRARTGLYEAVASWPGVLVVVSHDRALLELVDQIAELRDGRVRFFGGNLSAYEEAVAAEQETAQRLVRAAEGDVRRQRRELVEARTKLDRRARQGQRMWDSKREPKIVMGARKRAAQVSAGKLRNTHLEKLEEARDRLVEAARAVRDDDEIRVDLPATEVPAGRMVVTARARLAHVGADVELLVRGPERIALVGANGAGKSTLLRTLTGAVAPAEGSVDVPVPLRYLPQRLDVLDDAQTVAGNVARFAPGASPFEVRARLARFLFRGDRADQLAGALSGGERFRATLAAVLLAEPPPQLLLLDEPTNNLDTVSVRQLAQALESYRGALIVASHDLPFLRSVGITRWLLMDGVLTEVDPW